MGRPQSISREQILEAARTVFLREGISASTASIARAAGVSEGSIFKRFPTKEALFKEAIGIPDVRFSEELEALFDGAPIEVALERLTLRLVELFRELLPRMMMLWAHLGPGESPITAMQGLDGGQPMPLQLLRTISHRLEREQRQGQLRDIDPELLARVLIGSTHNFVFFEVVGVHVRQPLAATSFVRGVVDLVLHGAAAPATESSNS